MSLPVFQFQSLPSSNDWLLEHGKHHPHGTAVIVDDQTAGRGRFQRRWLSDHQTVCFSVLIRYALPLDQVFLLNLMAPLALHRVLIRLGYPVEVKFPNDLLGNNRKVAGVLVECSISGGRFELAVAGFGINRCGVPVNIKQPRVPPGSLAELEAQRSGSMMETPSGYSLMEMVRDELLKLTSLPARQVLDGYASVLARRDGSFRLGTGEVVTGQVRGLTSTGQIQVETAQGLVILPEGVEWLDG